MPMTAQPQAPQYRMWIAMQRLQLLLPWKERKPQEQPLGIIGIRQVDRRIMMHELSIPVVAC